LDGRRSGGNPQGPIVWPTYVYKKDGTKGLAIEVHENGAAERAGLGMNKPPKNCLRKGEGGRTPKLVGMFSLEWTYKERGNFRRRDGKPLETDSHRQEQRKVRAAAVYCRGKKGG